MSKTALVENKKRPSKKSAWTIPAISDYPSRAAWEAASLKKVLDSRELLRLLVTLHERRVIVLRAAASERLAAGASYRQIGEELWLSPQTISGIKKSFAGEGYRSYADLSKGKRKKKQSNPSDRVILQRPEGRRIRTKYGVKYFKYL